MIARMRNPPPPRSPIGCIQILNPRSEGTATIGVGVRGKARCEAKTNGRIVAVGVLVGVNVAIIGAARGALLCFLAEGNEGGDVGGQIKLPPQTAYTWNCGTAPIRSRINPLKNVKRTLCFFILLLRFVNALVLILARLASFLRIIVLMHGSALAWWFNRFVLRGPGGDPALRRAIPASMHPKCAEALRV